MDTSEIKKRKRENRHSFSEIVIKCSANTLPRTRRREDMSYNNSPGLDSLSSSVFVVVTTHRAKASGLGGEEIDVGGREQQLSPWERERKREGEMVLSGERERERDHEST